MATIGEQETTSASSVADLVVAARDGDRSAWEAIVTRFQPLVSSVTRRYRMSEVDAEDVSQTVWLRLVSSLESLREPRALPGWIQTTTARACLQVLAVAQRTVVVDPLESGPDAEDRLACAWDHRGAEEDDLAEDLLRAESRRAVRRGLAELPPHVRDLLLLVVGEPDLAYAQIGKRLGVPLGSIGPNRARYLRKLADTRAVRELREPADPAEADIPATRCLAVA